MVISAQSRIAIALATVYLVWGSTYLAIRVGVEHLPPALFAGSRFLIAGALLLVFALWRGMRLPASRQDFFRIGFSGVLMLVGANGVVTWSEQWVDSNQAALIVATCALWIAGMGTLGSSGERLNPMAIAGLLIGLAGVAVLVGAGIDARLAPPLVYLGLLAAPIFWAWGSVYSRRKPVACTPFMSAAWQMLIAGAVLTAIGIIGGELPRWTWHPDGLWALAYLVTFGSCIAYAAYYWLVYQVSPAMLGTYAYVNPAVAVALGWWLLNEQMNAQQLAGTAVILFAVIMVTLAQSRPSKPVKSDHVV